MGQEFDGNNDYIDVSVMDPHTYDELTFSAWYKSANNGVADDEYIFAHYDASSWFLIGPTDDGSYDDYIRYYIEVNGLEQGKKCPEHACPSTKSTRSKSQGKL